MPRKTQGERLDELSQTVAILNERVAIARQELGRFWTEVQSLKDALNHRARFRCTWKKPAFTGPWQHAYTSCIIAHGDLEPQGDATTLTWAMHGPQPFMLKVMTVFMNMDKMVGKDFETGLANLKSIAEA